MCDGEHKLVVCNAPYVRMYELPPELAQAGHARSRRSSASGWQRACTSSRRPRTTCATCAASSPRNGRPPRSASSATGASSPSSISRCRTAAGSSTHEDMTEYRRIEARIAHMAHHDVLTELPNRMLLREQLERALDGPAEGQEPGRALPRPRPLQGHQRHARPSRRRCAAQGRRRSGCRAASTEGDTVATARRRRVLPSCRSAPEQPVAATALADTHRRGDRPALRARRPSGHGRRQHRHRRVAGRRHRSRPSCSRMPTSPSTGPRAKGAAAIASSSRTWTPTCRRAASCSSTCARRWSTASSSSTTSRSSTSSATRSAASRPCCAGTIPSAASSRRASSFRWPRRPG